MRFRSMVVHLTANSVSLTPANIEESKVVRWQGDIYYSKPYCNIYDYLRAKGATQIVGIELGITSHEYDDVLSRIPSMTSMPANPAFDRVWRVQFVNAEEVDNGWDQVLTSNPFINKHGDVVMVLQLAHLSDKEYDQFVHLAAQALGE